MAPALAQEKAAMFVKALARLPEDAAAASGPSLYWVPGRIEVAGKHTDYAGGRSLLAAISKGFAVVARTRSDATVRIMTTFMKGNTSVQMETSFELSPDLEMEQGHWANYNRAVARRLCRNFPDAMTRGVDISLECDLPEASGMSTSSAIICYMYLVLASANDLASDAKHARLLGDEAALFSYLGFCENGQNAHPELPGDRGVGTFGGSEDHTAIMSGLAGSLKMFSYCPTKYEGAFAFPTESHVFVIMVSGYVAAGKGAKMGDYNNAAFLAFDAARAWVKANAAKSPAVGVADFGFSIFNAATTQECNLAEITRYVRGANPTWSSAEVKASIAADIATLDSGDGPFPLGKERAYAAGVLVERFSQFYDESEVCVPTMAKAFAEMASAGSGAAAAATALAAATSDSHRMTVEELHNTVEVTEWLPWQAMKHDECLCASAFGAGFGGSCWALVQKEKASSFLAEIEAEYKEYCQLRFMARHTETHPRNHEFLVCQQKFSVFQMAPGPGAFRVEL